MIVIEEIKVCRMLEGLFQFDKECEWNDAIEEAMNRFVNLPTVDAVEVVRCKDCKWYDPTNPCGTIAPMVFKCRLYGTFHFTEFFCGSGERRTDERSD